MEEIRKRVMLDDLQGVKEIIGSANLESKDRGGRTVLFEAVLKRNPEITELLLSSGANPNHADHLGWTPLHYAAQENDVVITDILARGGAHLNAQDKYGNTPIWRAVFASKGKPDIINILLQYGADPTIPNFSGVSAVGLSRRIANYPTASFFPQYS